MSVLRRFTVVFAVLVAVLALSVGDASAMQTHLREGTFAPDKGFSLFGAKGVAVDQTTGTVYASDVPRHTVYRFGGDGTLATKPTLTQADGTTTFVFGNPRGIAVDNSGGASEGFVYVADLSAELVRRFDAAGNVTAQTISVASIPAEGSPQAGGLPDVVNNGSLTLNGVATDAAGNVYVTDESNNVVDVFAPSGAFVSQLGSGLLFFPSWIAVDPAGDIYVTAPGLLKMSPSGECIDPCGLDPSGFSGVATDAAGNVYVSELDAIAEFDSAGNRIGTFGRPMPRPFFNGVGYVSGLAIKRSSGRIYALDQAFAAPGHIFGPHVVIPAARSSGATDVTPVSATLEGAVEPDGVALTECEFEYGTSPAYGQTAPCAESLASIGAATGSVPVHADVTGLAPEAHYYFRLDAGNATGAARFEGAEFDTPPAVAITPAPPSEDTGRTIKLSATLNDRGSALSACAFEYLTVAAYQANGGDFFNLGSGGSVPCEPDAAAIPADGADHVVSARPANLVGNTAYRFRVVATSGLGTTAVAGSEFTTAQTAPIVSTGEPVELDDESARLTGSVNPSGLSTTYYFEYGKTTAYGTKAPVAPGAVGDGRLPVAVAHTVTDLQPLTTYHYRLVAVNAVGPEPGADVTFTPPAPAPPAGRAYELVTGAGDDGARAERGAVQASRDGEAVTFLSTVAGAAPPARQLARRGPEDWLDRAVDSPELTAVQPGPTEVTVGVSDDGTKAVVVSRKQLSADAVTGDWNVYLHDLASGSYVKMASTPDLRFSHEAEAIAQVFVGGTPSFDHVLLRGDGLAFYEGVPAGMLYDYSGGALSVVSAGPFGEMLEVEPLDPAWHDRNQVSADGHRIAFRSVGDGAVYLSVDDAAALQLSVSRRAGDAGTPHAATLLGGDAELRHVYFFSTELTDDSSEPGATYLYRYDTDTAALTPLAVAAVDGETPAPLQVSADGSSVYWASGSALAPGAGAGAVLTNVYVWRDGAVGHVATLDTDLDQGAPPLGAFWASSNGRYLAFTARSPGIAAGVPNAAGVPLMYRYDADTGASVCASCAATGAKGAAYSLAAGDANALRSHPRLVDNRGEVFFDSLEALTGADRNEAADVYEYRDDAGLRLLSAGLDGADSALADVGGNGRDVFFVTSDPLVRADGDGTPDLYDARRGGGLPSQDAGPPDACVGTSCGGSPGASGQPGTANPAPPRASKHRSRACPKGKRKQRAKGKVRCVKKTRRAHGTHRHKHHHRAGSAGPHSG